VSTTVASDRHVNGTRGRLRCGVLVALVVFAALASRSSTCVSAASAARATLELGIMLVGAADRVGWHARVATALLIAGAVSSVAIVRASLQHAPGDQLCHPTGRSRLGSGLSCAMLHGTRQ